MASQVQRIWEGNNGAVTVDVTFDNVTGVMSRVDWVVPSGTLHILIQRSGQPDFQQDLTSSGGVNLPGNRYVLVQDRGGGWSWQQTSYSIGWHP